MKLSTLLRTLVVISAVGLFSAFSGYSLARLGIYETPEPCADCDPQALAELRKVALAEYETPMTNAEKLVYLFDPEGNRL